MLFRGGGASKPAVVRNVNEQLRPACCKPAHFTGKDRLVTDKDAESISTWKLPHDILVPFVEAAYIAGHAGHYMMDQGKRLGFAGGNEMNFVIDENGLALPVKKQRTVVRHKMAVRRRVRWVHRRFPFDGSCEEWVAETDGQCRGNLCELQILKGERRGRFRPHQKVWHFRGRGKADSCDFVEIRRVCLEPIRGVRFHFREIELHSAREMTSRWLRHQTRSSQRDAQQNYRHDRCIDEPRANRKSVRRARPCEECIETGDEERDPIDSRDGRELNEAQIRGGRIAKQVPGKTNFGEMRAHNFERHPEEERTYAG